MTIALVPFVALQEGPDQTESFYSGTKVPLLGIDLAVCVGTLHWSGPRIQATRSWNGGGVDSGWWNHISL